MDQTQEIDVFRKMNEIVDESQFTLLFGEDNEKARQIAAHKAWLSKIRRERPSPKKQLGSIMRNRLNISNCSLWLFVISNM